MQVMWMVRLPLALVLGGVLWLAVITYVTAWAGASSACQNMPVRTKLRNVT
jgi:hypothetical protein